MDILYDSIIAENNNSVDRAKFWLQIAHFEDKNERIKNSEEIDNCMKYLTPNMGMQVGFWNKRVIVYLIFYVKVCLIEYV